jgi:prepilin-type N-terminal cleavage/methylation domain-containing protein
MKRIPTWTLEVGRWLLDVRSGSHHPRHGTLSSTDEGFSLIELIVVIAITAVLAIAAIYSIPGLQADRDQVAAQTLLTHLQYARDVAVNRETTTKIVFSIPLNSYSVFISDTDAPGGYAMMKDPATQTDLVVNISQSYPDVALSTVSIGGNNTLIFSKTNGIPCDISGSALVTTGTISFNSGSTVTVTPRTGYVGTQ